MEADRMYREKAATWIRASVKIGSVMECQSPMTTQTLVDWLASKLKIGNESANTWMRIRPRKNDGIEYRMNARLVAALSPSEFRRTAWKMPSGRAIRMGRISEMTGQENLT